MGEPPGDRPSSGPGLAHDRARRPGSGRPPRSRPLLATAAFALAVVVNLVVVFWPFPPSGSAALPPHADKVAHVAVFAAVAWTGRRARLPAGPLLMLLALHGIESELVQHALLPARSGDPADAVADLAGVAVGGVLPRGGVAARLGS